MILNNYWELRRVQQTEFLHHASIDKVTTTMKDTSGNATTFYTCDFNDASNVNGVAKNWDLISNTSFKVGSSDAEGSASDYTLTSEISSGVTISNIAWNISTSGGEIRKVISFNVACSANDGFTIKEVGICKDICTGLYGSLQYATVMLVRTILDNPVTLANGESATITIEWVEG